MLTEVLNREPSVNELSRYLNVSVEDINRLASIPMEVYSLNQKAFDDDDTEIMELIANDEQTPEEIVITKNLYGELIPLLKKMGLSDREVGILVNRYGLDGVESKKLDEVANMFGLSRERVRQIEYRSLDKIRDSKHLSLLANYMDDSEGAMKSVREYKVKKLTHQQKKNS